ncbi:hypothetical protein Trydic_g732 [Trypoxylus dichotomus]
MTDPLRTAQQPEPSTSTVVTTTANTETSSRSIVCVRLKKPRCTRTVKWTEETVDNEHMNKKKSKSCCIYHKQRDFGESSSSSDESDDEDDYKHHHTAHHHDNNHDKPHDAHHYDHNRDEHHDDSSSQDADDHSISDYWDHDPACPRYLPEYCEDALRTISETSSSVETRPEAELAVRRILKTMLAKISPVSPNPFEALSKPYSSDKSNS